MKRLFLSIIVVLLITSCGKNDSYYDQITKKKSITERIEDLNKSVGEIRKAEKGKLMEEGPEFLEFEYTIGENDTYVISYLFDDKGCYEIGFDGYFEKEEDAQLVLDGFKNEISKTSYGKPEEAHHLARWLSSDESVSIELDYMEVSKGMVIVTIFANE